MARHRELPTCCWDAATDGHRHWLAYAPAELDVEASVSHYADTADAFLRNLSAADDGGQALAYISAVTVEEQELWTYNQGGYRTPAVPPHVPLAAIYPSDGTLIADHPFVTLQAPWVSDRKRQIADGFRQWLLAPAQQDRFAAAGFRNSLS